MELGMLFVILTIISHSLCHGSRVHVGTPRDRYTLVDYGEEHPLIQLQNGITGARRLDDLKHRFEPIRIHFRLEDMNPTTFSDLKDSITPPSQDAIDALVNKVIIPAGKFLEKIVRVVRAKTPLQLPVTRPLFNQYICFTRNTTAARNLIKQGGANFSDTDLVINVRAHESQSPNSLHCVYDQFDRATFGSVDLTQGIFEDVYGENSTEETIHVTYKIMIHEMLHILGLSSFTYAFWYDSETGKPRTQRPLKISSSCKYYIPDENVVRISPPTSRGPQHYELVTPTVKAVAQAQVNCSSRDFGGRLENLLEKEICIGDHFDSRWFQTEMMSDGLSMLYRDISPLSLAALEDTGWFLVDYSIVATSPLGLGAGCDFLFDDCLQDNAVIAPSGDQIFCNYENLAGCAPDLKSISFCSLRNLTYLLDETIPDEYDYFGNNAIGSLLMGGSDFCPLYVSWANSFSQHYSYNCTNPSGLTTVSKFESFGDNSRCVQSTVSSFKMNLTETQCKEFYGCPNYPISFNVPLCMTVTCNTESEAVEITFGNETVTCSADGQNIKLLDVPGASIRCPRLANICIDYFCPKNCAGRGVCDYSKAIPKCKCNDSKDPSPYCANSPRFAPTPRLSAGPTVAPASHSIEFGTSPEHYLDSGIKGNTPTRSPTGRPILVRTIVPSGGRDSGSGFYDNGSLIAGLIGFVCSLLM